MSEENILRIEIRPDGSLRCPEPPDGAAGPPTMAVPATTPRQLMRLFSGRNVALLRLIKSHKPQSVAELARISGRPKESLTRTLQRLASLGIVVMKKAKGRGKVPTVACDRLRLELPLEAEDDGLPATRANV